MYEWTRERGWPQPSKLGDQAEAKLNAVRYHPNPSAYAWLPSVRLTAALEKWVCFSLLYQRRQQNPAVELGSFSPVLSC